MGKTIVAVKVFVAKGGLPDLACDLIGGAPKPAGPKPSTDGAPLGSDRLPNGYGVGASVSPQTTSSLRRASP
jgi:hypothetical protein